MPRTTEAFSKALREYLKDMEIRGLSNYTLKGARVNLKRGAEILRKNNMTVNPATMTQEHLAVIRDHSSGGIAYRRLLVEWMSRLMKFCGNHQKPFVWTETARNRPRITPEEWAECLEACYDSGDIRGATVLLLESLTIRRIGVIRMSPEDIEPTRVKVTGKGRMGGKQRFIPITAEMYALLQDYLGWRKREIKKALAINPQATIPDKLIIWRNGGNLGNMKDWGLDRMLRRVGRRVGVHLTHHMIRRMACRELYYLCRETGRAVEDAMAISGHSTHRVFMDYAEITEDDSRTLIVALQKRRLLSESERTLISR
jgi:integrase